jgi:hypothetical protein
LAPLIAVAFTVLLGSTSLGTMGLLSASSAAATESPAPAVVHADGSAPSDTEPATAAPSPAAPSDTGPAPSAPAPAPTPPATTPPANHALPPVILSPADGTLVTDAARSGITVAGTATPGSTVQVLVGASSEPVCFVTPAADGSFSCTVTGLPSSSGTALRAIEVAADGSTAASSVTVRVLEPPVVTGGPRGALTNAVVQGTAFPGATVVASTDGVSCSGTADASGAWTCPFGDGITDGEHTVTATQSTPWSGGVSSGASVAVVVSVDVSVPAAPALASPTAGAPLPTTGTAFRGSGEAGATVSVFAGAHVLCQARVDAAGSWSCAAVAVPAGSYSVAVLQQDAAGNVSVQSGPLTLLFQDAATPPASSAPPTASASPGTTPAPAGEQPSAPDPSAPDPAAPADPGEGTAPATQPDGVAAPGTWSDSTRFTAGLQPALDAVSTPFWWVAIVIGALVLLLVAMPARLLSGALGTMRGWNPGHSAPVAVTTRLITLTDRVLGRNRRAPAAEFDRAPEVTVGPIARGVLVLLASAGLVMLSAPVEGQPAYLRLFLAATAAVALVTTAATVLPRALARAAFGVRGRVHVHPAALLITAALALLTRLADLEPALVFGLGAALVAADGARRADRAVLAATQVVCLLLVGGVAWVVSGALQPGGDAVSALTHATATGAPATAWSAALTEFVHVVALASFGSAAVLLLPIGRTAGRYLLDRSPIAWVALALTAFSALAMLYFPALSGFVTGGAGAVLLPVLVLGFAAVCVAVWVWTRFVAEE